MMRETPETLPDPRSRRLGGRMVVERVGDHRFDIGEMICSRCGVLWEYAEEQPCVTSTVDVLPKRAS